jgi:hypothetical protein
MTFRWLTELRGLVYLWEGTHEPLAIKREQLGAKRVAEGSSAPFKHLRNWTLRMMFHVHCASGARSRPHQHDQYPPRQPLRPRIGSRHWGTQTSHSSRRAPLCS